MSRVSGDPSREALSIGAAEGVGTAPPAPDTQVRGTRLRLGGRPLRLLGIVLALVGLLASLAELLARTEFLARHLPQPAWFKVSSHPGMDGRFNLAERLVREGRPIDCLFLGPSAVIRGVDTRVFGVAYRSRTGREIHCVNFGIGGAAEPSVALIAPILIKRYHARLFILGVGVRTEKTGQPLERALADEPWLRWHRGEFSVEGWLIERSAAYRRLLGIRRRLGSGLQSLTAGTSLERVDAIASRRRDRAGVADAWMLQLPRGPDSDLQPSEGRLAALEKLLQVLGPGRVIVVGLPANPLFLAALRERGPGYDQQMAALAERATRSGAKFFRLETLDLPPAEGWRDAGHVTAAGAEIFSRWLGERVGDAVTQGVIPDPAVRAARLGSSG